MSQTLISIGTKAGNNEMKSSRSRQYQYIKIDDYYFCLQQNPTVFAWLLFCKREDLSTIQPWLKKNLARWTLVYFRYHWKMFKRNVMHLIIFVQCRFGLRDNVQTVQLPVYGQFGMAVHKGYKIFNLRSGVVTKIFDHDVNQASILREIEQLKKVSQIDFAPSLTRWDMAERWYQEEYIRSNIPSAHRSADSVTFLKAFYQEAVPCMNSLMAFQPPEIKDLMVYLKELIGIPEVRRLSTEESTGSEFKKIKSFLDFMVECLRIEGNIPVYLVFTHGDFCPANMLNTRRGIKFIDWESAGNRSAFFDFYSYFFYRIVSSKNSVDKVASEINEGLPNFISGLAMKIPEIACSISHFEKVYRWVYYVEEVCKGLERERTDKNLNILEDILGYIEAFTQYEELLAWKDQGVRCVE
jgi:thiamine kinase-like enzyme